MNLAILQKSRRGPYKGDIFVMLPPDNLFLYGRVISRLPEPVDRRCAQGDDQRSG
jgi:hypothetical protein